MAVVFYPFSMTKDATFHLGLNYGSLLAIKEQDLLMSEEAKQEMLKLISEIEALMPELDDLYLTKENKKKVVDILVRTEAWASTLDTNKE